ncbi:uncharacterized protein Dyak_GE28378, isoform C [Drosophila yakuba]|uniref:Uncharacterized protein, isoform A n=1 Tax=Drosophila yakuba TaxID=7245 RepID=A0A0R1DJL1_DROYA|nr:uncharacterized protein Dyak_GE28378, isoform A [Drosophila yakuba]KRJ97478.1 uncharacterized protein Dyak_GE28378, isoform B [Drosophila yakuba]KRJ97479.1 uncharacterized protein Dyak_GE28378, isoform C [Drosophila yakuba]
MPRGTHLSAEERGLIMGLSESGAKISEIASRVSRHPNTVANFLKNVESYGKAKRSGRPSTIDERCKREIKRLAVNKQMSCNDIKRHLKLKVSRRRVHQLLAENKTVKYSSRVPVPMLLPRHISSRLSFAEKYKFWTEEFRSVIFSDEKKWNLDGPDGCHKYWRDLRHPRETRHKRNFGGGSLMVWAAFGYAGKSRICFIPTKTNSEIYTQLLEEELIDFATELYADNWTFQQDNAPIHTSRATKTFFSSKSIPLLEWPAISPDLSPIEDLWGILSARIYKNGRQFDNIRQLKDVLVAEWELISNETLQNLADSMPNRIHKLLMAKGKHINY